MLSEAPEYLAVCVISNSIKVTEITYDNFQQPPKLYVLLLSQG